MSKGGVLFDDIFDIKARDPDGKKFDKGEAAAEQVILQPCWAFALMLPFMRRFAVSRYTARSDLYECDLTLDVNIDVYPLEVRGDASVRPRTGSFDRGVLHAGWNYTAKHPSHPTTGHKQPVPHDLLVPGQVGSKYQVALACSLQLDGSVGSGKFDAVSGQRLVEQAHGSRPVSGSGLHHAPLCAYLLDFQSFPSFAEKRQSLMDRYEYVMYGKVGAMLLPLLCCCCPRASRQFQHLLSGPCSSNLQCCVLPCRACSVHSLLHLLL